ncbi:DNA repair protein complementing XP-C cells homolog isoform X2 [Chironomus tepperi]|uniref:DNA repair protein complementing XP-C cells homolog isoform X2 n=1 Tax=Chironomus tepperi TaxID=113505 RepID=UPI00391F546D
MSRPRRAASQKVVQQQKLDLSDIEESDDDADFSSQSSDEYQPDKSMDNEKTFEESEESEGINDENVTSEDEESPVKNNRKKPKTAQSKRNSMAALRREAISKLNAVKPPSSSSLSQNLHDILKKAQYNNKSVFSDSDSETENKVPTFDCSGGLRLSDGSDNSESEENETKPKIKETQKKTVELVSSIKEESEKPVMDLKAIHDNLEKMKFAREKLSKYSAPENSNENTSNNDNIADLLLMGENAKKAGASQKRKKASQGDESDSDNWEDVEEDESNNYVRPKEDVEILLNSFGEQHSKKDAKPVDVEAQLKRKFNKKRKEYQEHLHKTELMGWLTHCNFVNERLNHSDLMKCALDMLPKTKDKAQCYPKDKTDVEYFKQITKWFKQTIKIREQGMYSEFKKRPPLVVSLALQMKYKTAMCRRDYVLMYIILLRAIGVQCRMVQSLVMDPKICPKSELMSLSKKEEKSLSDNSKKSTSKSKSTNAKQSNSKSNKNSKSRSKKTSDKPKIPQLDGGDNEIPKDRKKRTIKLKGSSSFNVDESYIDINKLNKASPKQSENLAPKVKKNAKTDRLNHLVSPRKTRSASSEVSTLIAKKNSKPLKNGNAKVKETKEAENKKDVLKVLGSPRRLRSRSTEPTQDQEKTSKQEVKKPNLKSLSQKTPPKPNSDVKPKDKLLVPSPRRLRSRSRSTEDPKNSSENKTADKKNTTRKRQSIVKEDSIDSKKSKTTETARSSRKRQATAKPEIADPKKSKQAKEKVIDESDSDDSSLKYFRTISGSNKKPQASTSRKSAIKSEPKLSTSRDEIDRRILSTDDEADLQNASPKKVRGIDIWAEVYCEQEEKWICIDIFRNKVDCVKDIYQKATHPMVYVFAWNNDRTVKDVSARYCINLNTTIRKMRVDREYLYPILNIFNAGSKKTHRDFKEDEELNKVQFDTPMPTSIAEFKNHPLYVLKRHLLKFQAIYPPEPPILGYIRDEAIYPRDCVFTLHSRETWIKDARVVKLHEQAYKTVKTMKYDRAKNKIIKDVPLELFGIWQTEEYKPPNAENGIVPRNAYGNVELFKPSMLPGGTVHLQLPGLNKVCRKLGIDCSQAIVGFDSSGGWPYPVYDGFVVCKEFEEKVIDAWNREQEQAEQKEREKIEKRVYGNWKKLIKGLLIKQRLMQKYNNFEDKH